MHMILFHDQARMQVLSLGRRKIWESGHGNRLCPHRVQGTTLVWGQVPQKLRRFKKWQILQIQMHTDKLNDVQFMVCFGWMGEGGTAQPL